MRFLNSIPVILLSLIALSLASAQKPLQDLRNTNPLNDDFAKLAKKQLEKWHVPGIAISVVDGDETWAEGYGISKFPDTAVTTDTLFLGASTTKAFTAAALAILIASGNHSGLGWKTPVVELIGDDFLLEDVVRTEIMTVEDILSHRSGMPRHDFSYGGIDLKTGKAFTVKDLVRSLRHLPLTAGLRERFQYCNMMFVVASYAIERLTGMWLGHFLKREIWGKLGMKGTYFSNEDAFAAPEPLAQGYVYNGTDYIEVPYMDLTAVSGAGSIISNVLDYSKWLRSLLTATGPLSQSQINDLLAPRTLVTEKEPWLNGPKAYTLGWFNGNYRGIEYFEHSGGLEAFGTQVVFFPSLNYGLAAFGNTGATSNSVELSLIWHLIDNKLKVPAEERFDWDKYNTEKFQNATLDYENAKSDYYPSIPSPPLPLSLPMANYTGTYFHPAYHNLTINIGPSSNSLSPTTSTPEQLYLSRSTSWEIAASLTHITGDYFMCYLDSTRAPGLIFKSAIPGEFMVGADGIVRKFGIAAEEEMGKEGRIWFERIV